MIDYREQILAMAQTKPLLPGDVAKVLNTNLIMASAMLSELSDNKKLKVSKLKVGSSPLYFLPDKAFLLENFVSSLNEKDRITVEILKNARILRDSLLDSLTRVSLRQIGDFGKQVDVVVNGQKEIFWKWFLLPDSEAELLIGQMINGEEKKIVPKSSQPENSVSVAEIQKVEPNKFIEQANVAKPIMENSSKPKTQKIANQGFFDKISAFFDNCKIKIVEQTQIKPGEFDFVVKIPTPVGVLPFYCKAKNKKKLTESDVSVVFVQGQLRKLPVILLSDGEFNKQGKELLLELKEVLFQKL